jgi:hypothetical protein
MPQLFPIRHCSKTSNPDWSPSHNQGMARQSHALFSIQFWITLHAFTHCCQLQAGIISWIHFGRNLASTNLLCQFLALGSLEWSHVSASHAWQADRHKSTALFRYSNSPLNSTMQKEDSPSHQNVGIYMEY